MTTTNPFPIPWTNKAKCNEEACEIVSIKNAIITAKSPSCRNKLRFHFIKHIP
jgi:uncharacterized protein YbbK (DUF523 family)